MTRPALFKGKLSLFAITIALFSFFISCSNLVSDNFDNSDSQDKSHSIVYLTGNIDSSSRLQSTQLLQVALSKTAENTSDRAAIPTLTPDTSSSDSSSYKYFVTAETVGSVSESAEGTVFEDAFGKANYKIGLKSGYKWKVTAGVRRKSDNALVLSDSFEETISPSNPISSKDVSLQPSSGEGSLSLPITLDSSISDLSIDLANDSEKAAWDTATATITTSAITVTNIPAGNYHLSLNFKDTNGQIIYSVNQVVTIFPYVETNKWVAGSSTSSIIDSSGNFQIDSVDLKTWKRTVLYVAQNRIFSNSDTPDDSNDGSAYSPLETITGAVNKIIQNDLLDAEYTIYVVGTIKDSVTLSTTSMKSLTISKLFDNTAVVDGENSGTVFTISTSKPVKFKGITIQNGSATAYYAGGAISLSGGTVYIEDCNLISNTANNGGAIYSSGTLFIYGSTVIGNKKAASAPDSIEGGSNKASNAGGAIYMAGSTLYLGYSDTSTPASFTGGIYGNAAKFGGGIYAESPSNVVISGGTIANNFGLSNGGGIRQATTGNLKIKDTTITGNKVSAPGGDGGAIYIGETSKIELSGNVYIPCSGIDYNDVYLKDGTYIELNSTLTRKETVATLTLQSYAYGRAVLSGTAISSNYSSFAISDDSYGNTWGVNNEGKISVSPIELKPGSAINSIFAELGAKTTATSFELSTELPAAGTYVDYIDKNASNVMVWLDGTVLKYYITIEGYVANGGKLQLNSSSLRMFEDCSALTQIDTSLFDTSKVTDMAYMFWGCSSLTSLDVSMFDTSSVNSMSYMFKNCSQLTRLDLSNFDTSSLTAMKEMFNGCSILNTIYVSEDLDLSGLTTSTDMFTGCTALKGGMGTAFNSSYVDATYARIDGGEDSPGYFTSKKHLKTGSEINILLFGIDAYSNTAFVRSMTPPDSSISASVIKYLDIGEENYPVWSYNGKNYYYTGNEDKLKLHSNSAKIFDGCSAYETIDLSGFDTSAVTDMSEMFATCNKLQELDLSGFNTSKVTDMSKMFYMPGESNTALTKITVSSDFITSAVTSSAEMFKNCALLTGGSGTTYDSSVIDISYARIDGGTANPGYFTAK